AVQLGSGEVFKAQLPGSPAAALQWLATLPGPVRAVYEAGPTGFGLARAARAAGVEVMVCAPGAIPRQPGDRIKTDTRDALKLARLHAAGQLRAVAVPSPELEGLRDLVRAREDLRGDLMGARHRIGKLLLRRGLLWEGPGDAWSQRHLRWLGTICFDDGLASWSLASTSRITRSCSRAAIASTRSCLSSPRRARGRRRSRGCAACAASTR
ncbi:MAG: transposase, partial [Actinobacteria bacterium]|nr:transposase [Actinomycetota bacterium]